LAQPLNGGNNSSRNCGNLPVSTDFRESPQLAIVLDDRGGLGRINTHAFRKSLLRVIGSLGQRRTFYITKSRPLGRLRVDIVDGLADWAVPAPRDATQ
jgi:hypothetical protein